MLAAQGTYTTDSNNQRDQENRPLSIVSTVVQKLTALLEFLRSERNEAPGPRQRHCLILKRDRHLEYGQQTTAESSYRLPLSCHMIDYYSASYRLFSEYREIKTLHSCA